MNDNNCSADIRRYHDNYVKLSPETRKQLRGHRNANRDRLKDSLKEDDGPTPLRFQKQGSYAMHTTVQHPNNDYDIDDGVVFAKEDLVGVRGGHMSPLEARKMVGEALQDDRFTKKPEVLKNCVRVYYNEGYCVDVPVYRESGPEGAELVELASAEWKKSDPAEINAWFESRAKAKSHADDDQDDTQFRRLIRLLKRYCTSRDSWNLPSGFILTILVDEVYNLYEAREDHAFYNLLVAVKSRLALNLEVRNPKDWAEVLTKGNPDPKMVDLKEKLTDAIADLGIIWNPKATRSQVLKAWGKVFNSDDIDPDAVKWEQTARASVVSTVPTEPVRKEGGGRFG